jgi:hypothetical protein
MGKFVRGRIKGESASNLVRKPRLAGVLHGRKGKQSLSPDQGIVEEVQEAGVLILGEVPADLDQFYRNVEGPSTTNPLRLYDRFSTPGIQDMLNSNQWCWEIAWPLNYPAIRR